MTTLKLNARFRHWKNRNRCPHFAPNMARLDRRYEDSYDSLYTQWSDMLAFEAGTTTNCS
jgi:hypothetical protein